MNLHQKRTDPVGRRLIGAKGVAPKLDMSVRHVFRAADAGLIPTGIKVGRLRRWDEAQLDEWIRAGCPPIRKGVR